MGVVYPPTVSAPEGQYVEFNCKSDVIVTWQFNDGNVPLNAYYGKRNSNTYVLEIHNIMKKYNSGIYSCTGIMDKTRFISYGKLIVTGKEDLALM